MKKIKDFKIFEFMEKYGRLFNDLRSKISDFYSTSPENMPVKYDRYMPSDYYVQHTQPLSNLNLLKEVVLLCKEHPILNLDNNFVLYGSDTDMIYSDSSKLLLDFLLKLYLGWRCALPILNELSSNDKYKIENLESELIFFGLDLVPVVNEIFNILYLWHESISLKPPLTFDKSLYYYTVDYETPIFINHPGYEKYVDCSREFGIKKIIDGVFISKNLIEALDASLRRKIEYKFRIKDLDKKSAIEFVLREILSDDIDLRTLQFLGLNPPADFESMRQRSYFTLKE